MSDQAPLEKELKYYLSKEDYDTLIKATRKRVVKTVKQSNVYFDDPSLRLRKKK
ncbi:CYTH domain-containing protein, partial [bacterium]|nr:CYTH domain-containing protein [bacterium]